jgi:hypothetical protein
MRHFVGWALVALMVTWLFAAVVVTGQLQQGLYGFVGLLLAVFGIWAAVLLLSKKN